MRTAQRRKVRLKQRGKTLRKATAVRPLVEDTLIVCYKRGCNAMEHTQTHTHMQSHIYNYI